MIDVREKPRMVERAYLVGVALPEEPDTMTESLLAELNELVVTLGVGIVGQETVRIREPQARMLLGKGKAEAIIHRARAHRADCLVLDASLSPAQQRNWEAASGLCVIDRQEVILDIFSERAQTREAVLQVELARAEHSLPRLKNAWTHLSRQRGGGGVTQRGEGEAQIELDARMVRQRISRLKKELSAVLQHRDVQRKKRQRVPVPTAALVGYTNAGKSTLLNALTGADVLSADKLFATLDPTTRQLRLPGGQKLLLTDTVGFVRRLPHQLVEAFKATLEEAVLADFLIHVVDVSNPEYRLQQETTLSVLKDLGADEKRIMTVFNKVDRLEEPPRAEEGTVPVSALAGSGFKTLLQECEAFLEDRMEVMQLLIPFDRYDLVTQLHAQGGIRSKKAAEAGIAVVATVPRRLLEQYAPYQLKP
jgi:GTP-binding protein HflX